MKKHFKYLWYIIRHKWFVMIECWKMGLYWQGITHDLSKLLPSEWFSYAEYFYGDNQKGEYFKYYGKPPYYLPELVPYGLMIKDKFNYAWLKHIHRNPHHWQYWMLREDDGNIFPLPMSEKYIKEMLCDWKGAEKAITGKDNVLEWYKYNNRNMQLHPDTRRWIEGRMREAKDEAI